MSFQTKKINTEDKNDFYRLLVKQVEGLLSTENDYIANAANLSSLLFHSMENVNWVGFYFYNGKELVLGPFQGQVACTRIPVGKGVCGTAFETKVSQVVEDVNRFDGHIACDSNSASELVIPLFTDNGGIGVLDIDSPVLSRFDSEDEKWCKIIASEYIKRSKNFQL